MVSAQLDLNILSNSVINHHRAEKCCFGLNIVRQLDAAVSGRGCEQGDWISHHSPLRHFVPAAKRGVKRMTGISLLIVALQRIDIRRGFADTRML